MVREKDVAVAMANANSILFLLFMAIGCAYIMMAKFSGFPAAAVTFIPVLIMFVYAGFVKFVGFVRLRDDQAGDNLYYLGFLYTLTSLGVSLYQFRADGPAEEIVQNFGVAIGSTITGVALRVIFNQMRRDPADVEQAARLELSEAARRMRRELDATVVELAHFRRSAQQQVAEGFEHVREGMEEVSGRILSSFEEMTLKASRPFESASENSSAVLSSLAKTIGENLDGAARRLAAENDKLASETAEITSALKTTAERLAAMQTPDKVIEVRFEPIAASLASTMEGFAEQIRRKDEIDRGVIDAITRSGTQHQKQATMLANLAKELEKRTEAMMAGEQRAVAQTARTLRLLEGLEADRNRSAEAEATRDRLMLELTETSAAVMTALSSLHPVQNTAASGPVAAAADDPLDQGETLTDAFAEALEREMDLGSHSEDQENGQEKIAPPPITAVR